MTQPENHAKVGSTRCQTNSIQPWLLHGSRREAFYTSFAGVSKAHEATIPHYPGTPCVVLL